MNNIIYCGVTENTLPDTCIGRVINANGNLVDIIIVNTPKQIEKHFKNTDYGENTVKRWVNQPEKNRTFGELIKLSYEKEK